MCLMYMRLMIPHNRYNIQNESEFLHDMPELDHNTITLPPEGIACLTQTMSSDFECKKS